MILSDKKGVQYIVLALAKLGLREVVIAPGSRNVPLTISFNRHPDFHCTSIRDERSAAFFALGMAIELKEPVALLCTSGSAALNFTPAISEAYYQKIPLIVLTADRPKEWTGQGDGQTINQTDLYKNFIRASFELKGAAEEQTDLWYIERCLSEGFNTATVSNKGPVHFNVPLQEPLYNTTEATTVSPKIFREEPIERQLSEATLSHLASSFVASKKVMILVGQYAADEDLQEELCRMATRENVVVLTESTSNMHSPQFVENIDRCITGMEQSKADDLMPDLLITIGGAIVSKRIKKLLRVHRPDFHWNVHPFEAYMDTYQSLTSAVFMNPACFFKNLLKKLPATSSDYQQKWQRLKENKERRHRTFCNEAAYSDFAVFQKIYECIPADMHLHFSNSSPIRYAQLFDNSKIRETNCNRGTSGIDGCSSTAVGAAFASPEKDFLLITGDVAFHYDSNALWNNFPIKNLKIIILNNGGGGIFRIIEGPDKIAERADFLETTMHTEAAQIAAHYQWNYLAVREEPGLMEALKTFFDKNTSSTILEIFTDAAKNPVVLKQYWKFLKEKN